MAAFSLIEVVIALGIGGIILAVVIGLLPVALNSNRDSQQESQAVNLLQLAIADCVGSSATSPSSVYGFPPVDRNSLSAQAQSTLWINEDQITVTKTQSSNSRYRLSYIFYPASDITQPVLLYFKVYPANTPPSAPASMETLVPIFPQ